MEYKLKYFGLKKKKEEDILELVNYQYIGYPYKDSNWKQYYLNINGSDKYIQFPESLEIIELPHPPSLDKVLKFYCIGNNHEELSKSPDTKEINFINQLKEDFPFSIDTYTDITGMRSYYNERIITYCRHYSTIIRNHFIKDKVDYYMIKDKKIINKLKKECQDYNKLYYEVEKEMAEGAEEEFKQYSSGDVYQDIADECGVSRQEIKQNLD
ncbi:MAG: hypothetical protein HOK52_09800 [Candidatus Marinimicrobia bacterium]|jgi:hypothetical protein|nr:hypothetical protein [Candidatus Neomarinimicrobiota bacterium]MBT6936957.1 hypothetical protein [Candidatus Neomarinimicrobiota bacterium]